MDSDEFSNAKLPKRLRLSCRWFSDDINHRDCPLTLAIWHHLSASILKFEKPESPNSEIEMLACTPFNCNGFALHSSRSPSFKLPFQHQFLEVATPPQPPILHPPLKFNIRKRFNVVNASSSPDRNKTPKLSFRDKNPNDINILVVGSTGYIGKFVVTELVKRGFNVIAIARERSGIKGKNSKDQTLGILSGANVCFSDVTNLESLSRSIEDLKVSIDVVVSCLASRSGGVKDSWLIDYTATKNSLIVGKKFGAAHFVLLSAICVQKPLLEFQRAKLKFEAELIQEAELDESFSYSIVRPTAFFKSLAGQVELVKEGKPYVMFGDGKLCACKPISEPDLASFIADCVTSQELANRVLPIGGPGDALTPLEQGEMLFRLAGKEPKFLKVPIGIMDFVIGILDAGAKVFPGLQDAAEFGKIGRYYAAESMLVLDEETGEYSAEKTPSYGKDTLEDFFKRVLEQGMAGQELGEQMIF